MDRIGHDDKILEGQNLAEPTVRRNGFAGVDWNSAGLTWDQR